MSNMFDIAMTSMFYMSLANGDRSMAISESRIFYHWQLAKHGGAYLAGSLAAAGGAGAFIAAAHQAPRMSVFHISSEVALSGFVTLTVLAAALWWLFSKLQDEMFHRVQNYSYGWGAVVAAGVLILWGIANGAALAPPIDPVAPLLIFAVSKSFFWMRAVGTWL
jgi:hypothetical protein